MPTILITGANRGIGLEMTRQYARGGWAVLACCRSPHDAHDLRGLAARFDNPPSGNALLPGTPPPDGTKNRNTGSIQVYPLDVTHAARRAALSTRLQDRPIDILVNNAAISGDWATQRFGQCRPDEWIEVLRTNVIAPMAMIQEFVDNVAASGRRVIVNMSSVLGSIARADHFDGRYLYGSSKAALNLITAICAHDVAKRGITVVALYPGWVRTDMGGPEGTLSVEESVAALYDTLADIGLADSGRFMDLHGATIPW
uniref:Short-chain dehydrogenase n=1 Tax=Candidatus Kentrum sp. LFY TaxID=2126342 RepID=A0A450WE72_9GAMM|nr:MAG: Short-chain dehydrogenase [Candidatus Kentron sp. LFY]